MGGGDWCLPLQGIAALYSLLQLVTVSWLALPNLRKSHDPFPGIFTFIVLCGLKAPVLLSSLALPLTLRTCSDGLHKHSGSRLSYSVFVLFCFSQKAVRAAGLGLSTAVWGVAFLWSPVCFKNWNLRLYSRFPGGLFFHRALGRMRVKVLLVYMKESSERS